MDLRTRIHRLRTAPNRPVSDREGARGVDLPTALNTSAGHLTSDSDDEAAENSHKVAEISGPIRTCVGCREHVAKSDLVRLVIADESLVIDRDSTLPGRGAYLHPRPDCVDSALRRRVLPRALRWAGPLDADSVGEVLTAGISK